jgi:hypothetical protein
MVQHLMNSEMSITNLAEQINMAATAYRVGTLQELRSKLHGRRARTTKIFSSATVFQKKGYAFHDGGRQELQFNIGTEQRGQVRWWRHGVAFSFEASRSLPDPAVLVPKVRRFNEWVRANADALGGFQMWDWEASSAGADRSPGEILAASVEREAFVFLGARVPDGEIDVHRILQDFDRLYPLYAYVESGTEPEDGPLPSRAPQRRSNIATHTTVSRLATEIEVDLRHNRLQQALVRILHREFPGCSVEPEYEIAGGGRVDVAVDTPDGLLFCEIKVTPNVRAALREAIGQLVEYATWPAEHRSRKWLVVSEGTPSAQEVSYLQALRALYNLPVFYRRIDIHAEIMDTET